MSFIGNLCHAITLTPLESLIQRVNLSMPFGGILVRRLAHDAPSYSGVGASGKPGAVHLYQRRNFMTLIVFANQIVSDSRLAKEICHVWSRSATR